MPRRSNDTTLRDAMWRRFEGDDWTAYDALPAAVRARLHEHAYDAWSVNALMVWRRYRRMHPTLERAEWALLRYLGHCERLEQAAFASEYARCHGAPLPHVAAGVPVLRYGRTPAPVSPAAGRSPARCSPPRE